MRKWVCPVMQVRMSVWIFISVVVGDEGEGREWRIRVFSWERADPPG